MSARRFMPVGAAGVLALAGVAATLLVGAAAAPSASPAATDPGPQSVTCSANDSPCCDSTGTLCVSAPAQSSVGDNITFQLSINNTSSQTISGYVTAWLGGYEDVKFTGLSPGATKTAKMKWKAGYACSYCGWSFTALIAGWSYTPLVTITGIVD